jgi:sugar phosphate permease
MKNDHPRALFLIYVTVGLLLAVLALQTEVAAFAIVYLLIYMMIGLLGSPFDALFNLRVPSEDRSTMLSFMSLTMQAGGLIGNLVIGFIAGAISIGAGWFFASGVVLVSSLGFLYLILANRRAKRMASSGS